MENNSYQINKGVGKTVEFKGLKSQYLIAFFAGIFVLFILFVILRILFIPLVVNFGLIFSLGSLLLYFVFKLNKEYGTYGLMKLSARSKVPKHLARNFTYRNILSES